MPAVMSRLLALVGLRRVAAEAGHDHHDDHGHDENDPEVKAWRKCRADKLAHGEDPDTCPLPHHGQGH